MNAINNNPNWTCDTDALNALLGYQLSAVDTYDRAMTKFADPHALSELQHIREDHARSVVMLRAKVTQFGALQAESPGPWSTFTEAITGESNLLGLAALKQGEQHAINEYEEALRNEAVNPECKDLIRAELLPNDKCHMEKLDRLLGGMS